MSIGSETVMIETPWKTKCPICKWSILVYSQESAKAAKLAHEQIKGHRNVAIMQVEQGPAAGRLEGSGLPQRA